MTVKTDPTELSATDLSVAYRHGRLSPVEVVQAVMARIERLEPLVHALYAFDPEAALAQARASQERWANGRPLSALDGVPGTLKENIATRGTPVPLGSVATLLVPAADDAPPAARWREAGLVLLAKTTMPDYGMLSSGLSSFHPLTRNPWNLAKNPGGSSAGAAAAAAAGFGPLHVGTDIGGSIRLPAGWCGIVGLKPSHGRVPIHPPYTGRVAGPMTRCVSDTALLMSVLSRPDARDATSLPWLDIAWDDVDRDPREMLSGMRLGLLLDAGWGTPADAATRAAVIAAAQTFEAAGAIVETIGPLSTRAMVDGLDRFWRMRCALDLAALPPGQADKVLPYIRQWAQGASGASGEAIFRGQACMAEIRDLAVATTEPFDFVLSPVAPEPTFEAEAAAPSDDPARPFEHIAFTLPYNMGGQPAISVPCATSADGLPIGLQIAGRRHDDIGVLRLARAWERMRPALPAWPEPVAGR
jgi:Asp-tRNA(Asn)/Glu-tRNA(Gln) amidotransferase A subunit family amidase